MKVVRHKGNDIPPFDLSAPGRSDVSTYFALSLVTRHVVGQLKYSCPQF
jgi:hypothetical protein